MLKEAYSCDVCGKEIEKSEAFKPGSHPIFPDYKFAAAKGIHICNDCREILNAAAQDVIDSKQ